MEARFFMGFPLPDSGSAFWELLKESIPLVGGERQKIVCILFGFYFCDSREILVGALAVWGITSCVPFIPP
jgi:hypothetical protein